MYSRERVAPRRLRLVVTARVALRTVGTRVPDAGREHARGLARRVEDRHADVGVDLAELPPQTLGDRGDRRLGDRIDRAVHHGREAAVARRRVDDVTLVLRDERRHERVDPVDDPEHVHVDRPLPVVEVVLPHVALGARADTGVVADHVHATELRDRGVTQVAHRLVRRDVGGHADEVVGADLLHCLLQRAVEHVGEHDLHALLEHRDTDRLADAARATRDDADLAVEILHACTPLGWMSIANSRTARARRAGVRPSRTRPCSCRRAGSRRRAAAATPRPPSGRCRRRGRRDGRGRSRRPSRPPR